MACVGAEAAQVYTASLRTTELLSLTGHSTDDEEGGGADSCRLTGIAGSYSSYVGLVPTNVFTRLVLMSVQLAFARQGAKKLGESDDDWRRSDDSYSPRRHRCSMFKPDGGSVGPRVAYRLVMTLVSSDDDLDWGLAFDSRLGHPADSSEEPMAKRSKKQCEELPILHPPAGTILLGRKTSRTHAKSNDS